MRETEEVFGVSEEMRLAVGAFAVEVGYSSQRMAEDFVDEAKRRRMNMGTVADLAMAFGAAVSPEFRSGNRDVRAEIDARIVARLKSSRLDLIMYQPAIEQTMSRELKKNTGKHLLTPDLVGAVVRGRLEYIWRHEREHLLQQVTLLPEHYDKFESYEDKMQRRRREISWLVWAGFVTGGLGLGYLVKGPYELDRIIVTLGWASLWGLAASTFIDQGLRYQHYLKRPVEKAASLQAKRGKSLSGIFSVGKIERLAGIAWEEAQ